MGAIEWMRSLTSKMGNTEGIPPPGWKALRTTPALVTGILLAPPACPSCAIPGASLTSIMVSGHRCQTFHASFLHSSAPSPQVCGCHWRDEATTHVCPPAQDWATASVEPPSPAIPGAPAILVCPSLGPAPDDLLEIEPKKCQIFFKKVMQYPERGVVLQQELHTHRGNGSFSQNLGRQAGA